MSDRVVEPVARQRPTVTVDTDRHVAVITLDRPAARNAIDPATAKGLEAALDHVEQDDVVRVAILAGEPPVFCAGADLTTVEQGRAGELSTARGGFAGIVRRSRSKPLIAAVDGPALAGGMEIVLACDLVVASSAARFGLPEVRRGLVAAAGGLFRLPRRLPQALALEAILTGAPISVEVAARHGLVNRTCAHGEALAAARALADEIAANAPLAVYASLTALRDAADDAAAWERSAAAEAVVVDSDDIAEGVRAFFEKREPRWSGR